MAQWGIKDIEDLKKRIRGLKRRAWEKERAYKYEESVLEYSSEPLIQLSGEDLANEFSYDGGKIKSVDLGGVSGKTITTTAVSSKKTQYTFQTRNDLDYYDTFSLAVYEITQSANITLGGELVDGFWSGSTAIKYDVDRNSSEVVSSFGGSVGGGGGIIFDIDFNDNEIKRETRINRSMTIATPLGGFKRTTSAKYNPANPLSFSDDYQVDYSFAWGAEFQMSPIQYETEYPL